MKQLLKYFDKKPCHALMLSGEFGKRFLWRWVESFDPRFTTIFFPCEDSFHFANKINMLPNFLSVTFIKLSATSRAHRSMLVFPRLPFPRFHFPRLPFPRFPFPRLHFPRLLLSRLHFPRLPFPRSPFQGSTCQGSSFQGSTFQGSTFQGSPFHGAPFQGSRVLKQPRQFNKPTKGKKRRHLSRALPAIFCFGPIAGFDFFGICNCLPIVSDRLRSN